MKSLKSSQSSKDFQRKLTRKTKIILNFKLIRRPPPQVRAMQMVLIQLLMPKTQLLMPKTYG